MTPVCPFVSNVPFLYPLKTLENLFLMFSEGKERVHWKRMGKCSIKRFSNYWILTSLPPPPVFLSGHQHLK